MLENISLNRILFIDIETVPQQPQWEAVNEEMQKLWLYRTNRYRKEEEKIEDYYAKKAGVYAEFGKIVCISVGIFSRSIDDGELYFRVKSFYGDQEVEILEPFLNMLQQYFKVPYRTYLCGHNIREFDVPFLCRRTLINQLKLPKILDVSALKPWEVPYIDTMQLWRFGEYRNYSSLHLLATVLNIDTPKNDMEGSQVASVYWQDSDLERIKNYCEKDVFAVAQLILRFKNMDLLSENKVVYV